MRRNSASIPQKHPAAKVAVSDMGGSSSQVHSTRILRTVFDAGVRRRDSRTDIVRVAGFRESMEVLESTEKMDLGLQGHSAIVAASKECFSSAVKQPVDGLPLSNSVRVAVTGFARTPANGHAQFDIAVNTFGQGTLTAPLDTLAKSISKRSNVKPEEVSAGRPREIPA